MLRPCQVLLDRKESGHRPQDMQKGAFESREVFCHADYTSFVGQVFNLSDRLKTCPTTLHACVPGSFGHNGGGSTLPPRTASCSGSLARPNGPVTAGPAATSSSSEVW